MSELFKLFDLLIILSLNSKTRTINCFKFYEEKGNSLPSRPRNN